VTPAEQNEPWRGHTLTVTFTTSDWRRLIDADHLAEIGDLQEFVRRAALDKVGLIERLAARAGAS
jgi:hypothetical protein